MVTEHAEKVLKDFNLLVIGKLVKLFAFCLNLKASKNRVKIVNAR